MHVVLVLLGLFLLLSATALVLGLMWPAPSTQPVIFQAVQEGDDLALRKAVEVRKKIRKRLR